MWHRMGLVVLLACSASRIGAQPVLVASEQDFLTEMPVVLSVSRLPQRLDETPGAVTVLDRNMIRLSGARDVADLLLLVPGFQSSTSFEADAPQASYHGGFTSYSGRIQVLVDGRSAYSPFLFGSVAPGLQSVAIADIERIEVLRGSNSAAYGARAFLGVINIVTRDPLDTLGPRASLAHGENGVNDLQASLGWATAAGSFRLGADQRADKGLTGAHGYNRVNRINFRGDMRPTAVDELQLRAGSLVIDTGVGYAGDVGRPERDRQLGNNFFQIDWKHNLGADADLAFNFSHSDEVYRDSFFYALPAPFNGITIDSSGRASTDSLSVQSTLRHGADLRFVWGAEWRHEEVISQPLYATTVPQQTDFMRVFGNAEWRLTRDLVLNAGGLLEHNIRSGNFAQSTDSFAPRLMLNWHAAEGQTWRAGVSKAYRPPSTFESGADLRFVASGVVLQINSLARGTAQPETVLAHELGYLGEFPALGLNLDVRAFHERIGGLIRGQLYVLPPGSQLLTGPGGVVQTTDYVNGDDFSIRGAEYQLKWRPWPGAQLILNQAWTSIDSTVAVETMAAPQLASSLMWVQKLPGGLDFSLIHHDHGAAKLQGANQSFAMSRTDLRLGYPLRIGQQRGDVAVVMQNLGEPYRDFDIPFFFKKRVFVTLQLAY